MIVLAPTRELALQVRTDWGRMLCPHIVLMYFFCIYLL